MSFQRSTILKHLSALIACALFILCSYFIAIEPQVNQVKVQAEVAADETGVFAVYWPSGRGHYQQSLSKAVKYPSGTSKVDLIIPSFPSHTPLRIDPIADMGTIRLLNLSFERFQQSYTLSPPEIAAILQKTVDSETSLTASEFVIESSSNDPQLYLQSISLPLPAPVRILSLFAVLLVSILFIVVVHYRLSDLKLLPSRPSPYLLLSATFLLYAAAKLQWPVELVVLSCCFFVTSLQALFFTLQGKIDTPRLASSQLVAGGICLSFLLMLAIPCLKILDIQGSFIKAVSTLDQATKKRISAATTFNDQISARIDHLENALIRHFPYRDELVQLNANLKIFGLGFSPTPKAILGKNGMFFEGYGEERVEQDVTAFFDNVTDYMGLIPFSDKELEAWRICLEERYFWLKERGVDYVFALAPSKALIYKENLPDKILGTKEALDKPTRYDQLVSYLSQNSQVPFVDLSKPLRQAKLDLERQGLLADTPLYYRTDFHWTYYGSYVAYRAIIDKINLSYPNYQLKPVSLDQFTINANPSWVHVRFIYALGLDPIKNQNETYLTFMPTTESILAGVGQFGKKGIDDNSLPEPVYNLYSGHMTATRELDNEKGSIDTIFVVGDSFSEKYFGYFSAHAQKTVNFRTVYSFFTEPYIEYAPDLVIQEVLNMYLLQPPPTNPEDVQAARQRALAGKQGADNLHRS